MSGSFDFIDALLANLSTSLPQERGELCTCLEALGPRHIDDLILSIERFLARSSISALRSAISGDLAGSDEFVIMHAEIVICFIRVFQGGLQRRKDQIPELAPGQLLRADSIAIFMPFAIELVHISQFQDVSVASRLMESALSLVEDLSNCSVSKCIISHLHGVVTW